MLEQQRLTESYVVERGVDAMPAAVEQLLEAHGLRRCIFDPTLGESGKYRVKIPGAIEQRRLPVTQSPVTDYELEAGDIRFLDQLPPMSADTFAVFCEALGGLYL